MASLGAARLYIQCFGGKGVLWREVSGCLLRFRDRLHLNVLLLQGVVCTLHEGDDFGKLALVNDAPRAASIVLREDNCHFLRVDKEDFNRILRVSPRQSVAEAHLIFPFARQAKIRVWC